MKLTAIAGAALIAMTLAGCGGGDSPAASTTPDTPAPPTSKLASIDESLMLSSAEAKEWLTQKDNFGPAYAGSKKYFKYLSFLEEKMRSFGMVDFLHYSFTYPHWETTEWPDKSGWSLVSDGAPVDVASYATMSGTSAGNGVTAQMVLYDMNLPAAQRPPLSSLAGKIVVIKQALYSSVTAVSTSNSLSDYEYRSNDDTFPVPINTKIPADVDTDMRNRQQMGSASLGTSVCVAGGAKAAIWVLDMSPLAAQGTRQHSTPNNYECPGVMVDRVAGEKVVADATAGKTATVTLKASITNTRPYTIVAYLPGKNYGKDSDQQLVLSTHTDGMSNVEDNGAMGLLGVLKYYSQIPQAERPRTLMAFFDTRHFVAGAERAYPFDYFTDFEDAGKKLVGGVAMEHVGGMQFAENGNTYAATGRPAHTNVFGFPNKLAIETATSVIKEVGLQRAVNSAPTPSGMSFNKVGINGKSQGFWFGGGFAEPMVENGHLPGWHVSGDWPSAGFQSYWPATNVRVDPEYFRTMVRSALRFSQILSTSDLTQLAPDWGVVRANIASFEDADFQDASTAAAKRTALLAKFDGFFQQVRKQEYSAVATALPSFRTEVQAAVKAASATNVLTAIDAVTALAQKGKNLPE